MTLEVSKDNFKINSLSQNNSIFYIFEIKIKENECSKIIRRIKNFKFGDLITDSDKISCNIDKIKFSVFDVNDPLNVINIKKKLTNKKNNYFILSNSNLVLELYYTNENLICNYKFIN